MSSSNLLALFIINRSGSLVYNQDLSPAAPKLTANEWLRLGSTFHSLYAIAAQVAPVASSGIETLETNGMALRCLQSQTGVKFVLTAVANTPAIQMTTVLQTVYELYTDYVLKNPFYELEMPIRCELFTQALNSRVAGR